MNILQQHIDRLKNLPRHGQDEIPGAKDFVTLAEKFFTALKDESKVVSSYTDIFTKLNDVTGFNQQIIEKRIGVAQLFSQAVQKEVQALTFLERRNLSLNKTLGVSSDVAGDFGNKLDDIAVKLKIGGGQARRYTTEFNKIAPLQTKNLLKTENLANELFEVQRALTDQLGLAPETAKGIQLYGNALEGSTKDNVANMMRVAAALERQTNLSGAAVAIFQDIGNLGADIQMQFGRIPGSLEKAVLQARMLGTDFGVIANAGSKLLDIESSINKELEFQLLSGRRLVDASGNSLTAALREATVRGDAAAAAEAMQKIIEQEGETIETNLFARQELAGLLGVSEDKLMKMVQTQKMMGSISGDMVLDDETKGIVSLGDADTTATGQDDNKSLQQLAEALDLRSTQELRAEQTQATLTEKIIEGIDQRERINKTRELLIDTMKDQFDSYILSADAVIKNAQDLFLLADKLTTLADPISQLTELFPGGKYFTGLFKEIVDALGQSKFEKISANIEGDGTISAGSVSVTKVGGSGGENTDSNSDALVQVNDAVLFDPNDRFNILASTSQGSLDKATADVSGGNGLTAEAIASAVADAIAGIQIVTRIDDINEAQSRNDYNINAVT